MVPYGPYRAVSKNPGEYRHLLWPWQEVSDHQHAIDWEVFSKQYLRWYQFGYWQRAQREEYHGCIPRYTAWAKKLLARFSLSQPFEFDEDPERQDQLTTWIEYLAYEYSVCLKYSWYKRDEEWCHLQWVRVENSGLLKPHETYDAMSTDGRSSSELYSSNWMMKNGPGESWRLPKRP